jgi:hypothetical protein
MPSPAEWVAAEGPQMRVPLISIKRLYRDRNGALWGIPYDMRPGQAPRDLLGVPSHADNMRGRFHDLKDPAQLGWAYLGTWADSVSGFQLSWWGSYNTERLNEVRAWLATVRYIPGCYPEHCVVEIRT